MPDWIAGADTSHYQNRPDFDRLQADGIRFVIVKATQGMSVDPDFDWARNEAIKRSMPVLCYPFLDPDDNDASIQHFINVVGKGGIPALDWEAQGVSAAAVERWMDQCEAGGLRPGWVYRGKWPPDAVTPRITQWPWWYAQYPGSDTAPPRIPVWDGNGQPDWSTECLAWQWTGNGRLPGINTEIDLDRIAIPWDLFNNWYATGRWVADSLNQPKTLPQPLPQLTATADPITRTLFVGCTGSDVTTLQARLGELGSNITLLDGEFGPETKGATIQFQTKTGTLKPDGIAGPLTTKAMWGIA